MNEDEDQFSESVAPYLDEADEEADRLAILEAEADIAAGRCIPHEEVAAWLDTWGTPDFKPMPESWLK